MTILSEFTEPECYGRPFSGSTAPDPSMAHVDAPRLTASREPIKLLVGLVGAGETAAVFFLSLLAFAVSHRFKFAPPEIIATSALASVMTANILSFAGAYGARIRDSLIAQVWRSTWAWTAVVVLLLTAGFLTKTINEYSRLWAALWYTSVVIGLATIRFATVAQLRRWRDRGRLASTVAIVDFIGCDTKLTHRIANFPDEFHLVGVFSNDNEQPGRDISYLIQLSRQFRIDEVFVLAGTETAPDELSAALRRLGTIPATVRICPLLPELGQLPIRDIALLHDIPTLTVHRRPLGGWSSVAKRTEDLVVGGLALIAMLPVMLIAAIAIKFDSPGPVIFRQARHGFNNNVIYVLKFRTMTHSFGSDEHVVQATRDDRRVTRVGRILRRTSLDELPQIFNVLRGQMSIVGPRPHAIAHNQQYAALIDGYFARQRVQPGITGWAQVNGLRGQTDKIDKMEKRVEYDLSYIDNWSIALDLKIILLTIFSILYDREAY
jgi:Undecaprenyl-phosphate glucose phosphotransferase